ncbi:MAG: hypothetical protein ACI4MI_01780 [Christensenellales bacterium]
MNAETQQAYQIFTMRCREITASKYIMSGNYIMRLLRYVAATPCLMDFVAKCNQGFNYREEFELATSGASFRLPSSKKKIVALVTGMLFEADRNQLNLNAFFIKYFGVSDYEEGYKLFCKSVIEPYVEAFAIILDEEDQEETPDSTSVKDLPLSDNIKEQIYPYISAMKEVVMSDRTLKEKKRADYMTMLEGFYYSVEMSNSRMIKVVWLGLDSIFESYRPLKSYVKSLRNILESFAVI